MLPPLSAWSGNISIPKHSSWYGINRPPLTDGRGTRPFKDLLLLDTIKGREDVITVACAQFEPKVTDPDGTRNKTVQLILSASKTGARLIVLPELCSTGCMFSNRQELIRLAEKVPDGRTTEAWVEIARRYTLWIVAGIAEMDGSRLYNTAVLVGPSGFIGKYRKTHLWHGEKVFFDPGDLGMPVFSTPIGRIGIQVCYDIWFVEMTRILAMQGADIICVPTNWVPLNDQELPEALERSGGMPMANYISITNAHLNCVWVACCSRTGVERGQSFLGRSIICIPQDRSSQGLPVQLRKRFLLRRTATSWSLGEGNTSTHSTFPISETEGRICMTRCSAIVHVPSRSSQLHYIRQ